MNPKQKKTLVICCAVLAVLALGLVAFFVAEQNRNTVTYKNPEELESSSSSSSSQQSSSQSKSTSSGSSSSGSSSSSSEVSGSGSSSSGTGLQVDVQNLDFEALQAINSHIYAWLDIPGTDISYPILQHPTETDYYLMHTYDDQAKYPGSIYTQTGTPQDFSGFNTLIYGHDAPDFSMFGSLEYFRDESFLQDHRTVKIYTPEEELTYRIFAAVVYSNKLIPYYYDDTSMVDRQAFLDSLSTEVRNMNNHILDDVDVSAQDQIITLSTCLGFETEYRYLVTAVRVYE